MLSRNIKKIINAVIPPSAFEFDSDNGLILKKGYGQAPTSIRSTTGTVINFEGLIENANSAEARFAGARRVENLLTSTLNLSTSAGWIQDGTCSQTYGVEAPDGSLTATTITHGATGTTTWYKLWLGVNGLTYISSIWVRRRTGTGTIALLNINNSVVALGGVITSNWKRISIQSTRASTGAYGFRLGTVGDEIDVWRPQLETVTGQTNKNPSEYVSANVLTSSPYHGADVDSVKYFSYQNGNTVTSYIVTESQGTLIPETTRKGFIADIQRKNLVIQSQALSTWTAIGTPTITSANKKYGTLVLDLVGDDNASGLEGYKNGLTFTGDAQKSVSFFIKLGTSTKSVVKIVDTTATADRLNVEVTWSGSVPILNFLTGTQEKSAEALVDGVYRIFCLTYSVTAANSNEIHVYPATDGTLAVANTGNVNIGGFQVEDILFAGHYIPTTTATVTTNADVLYYPSVGNIASFPGTVAVEFAINTSTAFMGFIWASQADSNNYVALLFDGTNLIARKRIGGANYDATIAFVYTSGTKYKAAMCWGNEGVKIALNGALGTGHTNNATPSIGVNIYIGSDGAGANQCCGAIRRLRAFRQQLTSRQLMELSA